jgi:D-alanine-D-alanine ligase
MVGAYAYGDVAMIEEFVAGTEIAVSIIESDGEPLAMPAVEIVPDGGFYDYNARYTAGVTEFFCPARISDDTARQASELSLDIHRRMGLRDYSRVDLIVGDDGRPTFIEVNVAPGITETSLLPQALEAAGRDLGSVFAGLVRGAISRGL